MSAPYDSFIRKVKNEQPYLWVRGELDGISVCCASTQRGLEAMPHVVRTDPKSVASCTRTFMRRSAWEMEISVFAATFGFRPEAGRLYRVAIGSVEEHEAARGYPDHLTPEALSTRREEERTTERNLTGVTVKPVVSQATTTSGWESSNASFELNVLGVSNPPAEFAVVTRSGKKVGKKPYDYIAMWCLEKGIPINLAFDYLSKVGCGACLYGDCAGYEEGAALVNTLNNFPAHLSSIAHDARKDVSARTALENLTMELWKMSGLRTAPTSDSIENLYQSLKDWDVCSYEMGSIVSGVFNKAANLLLGIDAVIQKCSPTN